MTYLNQAQCVACFETRKFACTESTQMYCKLQWWKWWEKTVYL